MVGDHGLASSNNHASSAASTYQKMDLWVSRLPSHCEMTCEAEEVSFSPVGMTSLSLLLLLQRRHRACCTVAPNMTRFFTTSTCQQPALVGTSRKPHVAYLPLSL